MKRSAIVCPVLLAAAVCALSGCHEKVTPPEMPHYVNPAPGPGASPQEVERHQLEEEKTDLMKNYGDNLSRIQQINARLIELNLQIERQRNY